MRGAALTLPVVGLALGGCATLAPAASHGGTQATGRPHGHHRRPVVTGRGWTSRGLQGPIPGPGECHVRHVAGEPLPDPRCTPGAVDRRVEQADLFETVCRPGGYTDSVRPPESLTEPVKRKIMAAYGIPWSRARSIELDHLVPLEAGGSSSTLNLWPESSRDAHRATRSTYVENDKDQVEDAAREALCYHHAHLRRIQGAFAREWVTVAGHAS